MRKHIFLFILMILLLSGCSADSDTLVSSVPETTELPAPLDMDHSVYFSVVTRDGLPAASLSRLIYEQPEIFDNVAFEYMVYTEDSNFDEILSKEESDFVCVSFDKGIETLLSTKGYVLYAIMEDQSLEEPSIAIALLVKQATLNIYPEVVATFFRTYEKASVWSNDHPERVIFYLEQLEIESEITKLTYKRSWLNEAQIIRILEADDKTEDEIVKITKSIFKP